jgi:hypothetical protein
MVPIQAKEANDHKEEVFVGETCPFPSFSREVGDLLLLLLLLLFVFNFVVVCRFVAAHLVGRRLIYPGSLSLLNAVLCKVARGS